MTNHDNAGHSARPRGSLIELALTVAKLLLVACFSIEARAAVVPKFQPMGRFGAITKWLETGKGHLSLGAASVAKVFSYFQEEHVPQEKNSRHIVTFWAWVYRDGGSAAVLMGLPGGSVLYWSSDGINEATAAMVVAAGQRRIYVARGIPLDVYSEVLPEWAARHKWLRGQSDLVGVGPLRSLHPVRGIIFLRLRRFLWYTMRKADEIHFSTNPVPAMRISDPSSTNTPRLRVNLFFHHHLVGNKFPISGMELYRGTVRTPFLVVRNVTFGASAIKLPIHRMWTGNAPAGFNFVQVSTARLSQVIVSSLGEPGREPSVAQMSRMKLFLRWAGGPDFVLPEKVVTTRRVSTGKEDYLAGSAAPRLHQHRTALKFWRRAAATGNGTAMNNIGDLYYYGQGVPQDYSKAMNWYRRAALRESADAMNNIGGLYAKGQGVQKNYSKAIKWYRKAATAGNNMAMESIGYLYKEGWGFPKDYAKAMTWYRKAAAAGNRTAMNNIGVFYNGGLGVPQNYLKAMQWYRRAAANRSANAMDNIGAMYGLGQGVPQNYLKAMQWCRRAAAAGLPVAMYNIGVLYTNGSGVRRDYGKAKAWLEKAAAAGYAPAKQGLEELKELAPAAAPK